MLFRLDSPFNRGTSQSLPSATAWLFTCRTTGILSRFSRRSAAQIRSQSRPRKRAFCIDERGAKSKGPQGLSQNSIAVGWHRRVKVERRYKRFDSTFYRAARHLTRPMPYSIDFQPDEQSHQNPSAESQQPGSSWHPRCWSRICRREESKVPFSAHDS